MSNKDDYLARRSMIEAIPHADVRSPNMPVDVFLQEAENLYQWCQPDQESLVAAGLDWNLVLDLPGRAGALREAQSLWFSARFSREAAQKEWNEKSPLSYDLRDHLLRSMRYAYRHDATLLGRVTAIAEGSGHADMIQDLNNIAVLGKDNPAPLLKINFDMTLLDIAANTAKAMADLLSKNTITRIDSSKERILRDQAFTYLHQAVDELRACAQYVFWRNEARLKGYVSQYFKAKRAATPTTTAAAENEV
jgi:hypothetical protein